MYVRHVYVPGMCDMCVCVCVCVGGWVGVACGCSMRRCKRVVYGACMCLRVLVASVYLVLYRCAVQSLIITILVLLVLLKNIKLLARN